MSLDLTVLTLAAVMIHLGTTLAGALLKDKTDQAKIAAIDAKTDQVLSVVSALAPAVPTAAPKTLNQVATDLANVAAALAAATAAPAGVNTTGGTS